MSLRYIPEEKGARGTSTFRIEIKSTMPLFTHFFRGKDPTYGQCRNPTRWRTDRAKLEIKPHFYQFTVLTN